MKLRKISNGFLPFNFYFYTVPIVVAVVVMALFLSLGTWQLQRADEKRQVMNVYQQRMHNQPKPLMEYSNQWEENRYAPVYVSGEYSSQQFLLDNQSRNKQYGFNVLTPISLNNGDWLLVDRGWLAGDASRRSKPDVGLHQLRVNINAVMYTPFDDPFVLDDVVSHDASWPKIIQYLDFDQLGDLLGVRLLPVILRLDADSGEGYLREWPVVSVTPERHWAYAVQWYGMALAVLLIVLTLGVKKKEAHDD